MTKRYTILQKKMQELESELHQLYTLPSETPCHHLLTEGIDQRFVFLNKILSAEIASDPKKPHHLHHMADRLAQLETAFHNERDGGFKTTTSSSSLALLLDHVETASNCSCTESCLNDDGGGDCDDEDDDVCADLMGSQVFEDPESVGDLGGSQIFEDPESVGDLGGSQIFEDPEFVGDLGGLQILEDPDEEVFSLDDKAMEEKATATAEEEEKAVVEERDWVEKRENGRGGGGGGWCCGSMASGVMVGMALMWFLMVAFSGCFDYMEHDHFVLTPT